MTIKIDGTNGVLQAYDYQASTTGFSYTFAAGTQALIINPADALATGTITMPASPADGMTISVVTTKTINALTVNANAGQSIVGGGTLSLGNNQDVSYVYRLADTTWYPFAGSLPLANLTDVYGTNTTGTVTSGTAALTVASASGIYEGDYIVGEGIAPGTYVTALSGTAVTMSANANATLSADPVTFYSTGKAVTPASIGGRVCRAWVNFNGTGTVAIRASNNVSSITDDGTGLYTVNFTTAMVDANYSAVAATGRNGSTAANLMQHPSVFTYTTSAVSISSVQGSTRSFSDANEVSVTIFR